MMVGIHETRDKRLFPVSFSKNYIYTIDYHFNFNLASINHGIIYDFNFMHNARHQTSVPFILPKKEKKYILVSLEKNFYVNKKTYSRISDKGL